MCLVFVMHLSKNDIVISKILTRRDTEAKIDDCRFERLERHFISTFRNEVAVNTFDGHFFVHSFYVTLRELDRED